VKSEPRVEVTFATLNQYNNDELKGFVMPFSRAWLWIAILLSPVAHANLIQNGDFAGGSGAGWTFEIQNVDISSGAHFTGTACPDCSPFATFNTFQFGSEYGWFDQIDLGYGTIRQTLATTPGATYQVSYLLGVYGNSIGAFFAAFGDTAFLPSSARVWNGTSYVPPPADYLQTPPQSCHEFGGYCGLFFGGPEYEQAPIFTEESFVFSATGSSTVLEFAGSGPGQNFILSRISVVPVAEPSSLLLCLGGFGWLTVLVVRRRTSGR
jgi:hypothetical protein